MVCVGSKESAVKIIDSSSWAGINTVFFYSLFLRL